MQIQVIITIVKISSLIVAAQKNLALEGTVSQSSTLRSYYAYLAIKEPVNNEWSGGCSHTAHYYRTAWWRLKLPKLVYVTNVKIYYRNDRCWKGTWGVNCLHPCPANCIANHCYPENGSCVWGCDCLHDTCDMITSICTEGCKAGLIGQYCNNTNYNLASNGIATQTPSNANHPAYMSVDGNRTGICSMTFGSKSYLQVDTGYMSVITMVYMTFGMSTPYNNSNYSVYCSNKSDSWNNGIEIYNGERPTEDIYVTAVCRYIIYVPPIMKGTSVVDLCEIEIGGCPVGKYGVNCKMNCSANCISKSCDLYNGNCTYGCTDGWVNERCNETCSEGWFGKQCLHKCSPNCYLKFCDHVTGKCNGGCNNGWTDYNCSEECNPGYFGRNCIQTCEGCISELCDRFYGTCNVTDKCKPGYKHDPNCSQSCDNSYYGDNCTEKCNCLSESEPCDKSTGMCPDGKCNKGWSGNSCNEECSEGYYGVNCFGYCNNCLNTSCEIYEGNCTYGCNFEFSGPQCKKAEGSADHKSKEIIHTLMKVNNKIGSSLTNQCVMYENVKGNFTSSENIRLSFTEKHDRKINICEISSYDLPDTEEEEEENVNVYGNVISDDDICQYKIRIEDLANVIIEKRHNKGFEKEYMMFPKGLIHAHIEGSKEENKTKNRFLTTWPYDHSRVVLKGDTQYDYINANYIDSYHKEKAYIATQGPKRRTVRDFWHMVWQENVFKIVMVTQLEEDRKKKCDQYWPQTTNKPLIVDCYTLTMQVEKEHSEYVYRLIKVGHKTAKEQRKVHHYHFTQWPDHGVPDSTKLVNFYRAVKNNNRDQHGPLLVHCSAGIGRTGTFIAIDSLYEHGKSVGYVNIVEYVKIMRKDRLNMIQTVEQYEAVFEALQELFTVPDTSIPVKDFCRYVDEQDNKTIPQNQKVYRLDFQRLQSLRLSHSVDKYTSARLKENISKNVVKDILPSDNYRPYLMSFGKNKNDYINAVIIPGYSSHGSFLVTQCPLKETVVDFWTMVYDHDSSIVVLLDSPNEDAPLWLGKNKTLEFENYNIDLDIDNTPEGVQLSLVHRGNQPDKRSIFVFSAKEFEIGNTSLPSTTNMNVLLQRVTEQRKQRTGPVTVVCRNGATKSGLFVALSLILEKMKIDDQVDVFQVIRTIQLRRPEFLSNFDQYEYCYKCIKDFLEGDSVYANL
ncbi:Tyrosine-protein phosphatase non-receptor type 5,Receptor-type tyrosine-protein phosphatase R,Receptor-type tyrosine-protein phosphatase eta,Tyrosine-protein phosphatase 10D,Tyrosine-protein phosphatase non-receptor type 7,Receptor-type tyrosine-protein phosphatase O,Receptor-type tyrosine-protein phosphatase beta [Mytilus coruscus]|uniref:protein-tyrosine-phosphatase n=1 Tax=Mytilus coruscus TaxID=42192 RepID=A0A6J8B8F0_MYTCO|nr:Tyrosine-protein phosphatase non-receptor type 5,Receptor-type tyrosine-protein phosphatase R,Receptor-type tyrosine-protein phosphatase eta,Tyrosine-protein phosphatase 10D,Tyrosine-protein phosphatase non-receptor type 7,Receptor-type tyrosine-protein phosphatase O,Receptor-type tyrosine-protein phosphatase beta [Mytilus coruscus]